MTSAAPTSRCGAAGSVALSRRRPASALAPCPGPAPPSPARKGLAPNQRDRFPRRSKLRAAVGPPSPAAAEALEPDRASRAARQGRAGATEPRQNCRRVIPRGLAQRQIAPDSNCGLGLLDILEKGKFAVKAAPAAGLEQFGQIFQPLLGKSAPARNGVATACHVDLMCHEFARKEKNGRGRNERESIKRDTYILWKT